VVIASPPALGSTDHRGEHELQHRLPAEGVGNDLQAATLQGEQPLEQAGGADRPAMADRQPETSDAGLEIVLKTGDGTRQVVLVVSDDASGQTARDDPARCLAAPIRIAAALVIGAPRASRLSSPGASSMIGRAANFTSSDRPSGDDSRPSSLPPVPAGGGLSTLGDAVPRPIFQQVQGFTQSTGDPFFDAVQVEAHRGLGDCLFENFIDEFPRSGPVRTASTLPSDRFGAAALILLPSRTERTTPVSETPPTSPESPRAA